MVVIAGYPGKYCIRAFPHGNLSLEIVWLPRGFLAPRHLWFQLRHIDLIGKELSSCDVVHGQDSSAFPLLQLFKKRGLKIPWLITFHTNPRAQLSLALKSFSRGASLNDLSTYAAGFPLWDLAVRQHIRSADRLVCVSNSLRTELSRGYRFDISRMRAIHTCVNISKLRTHANINSPEFPANKVRLLYAGRLYYSKGVLQLLGILADLSKEQGTRNFTLSIFGAGPLERGLRKYANRYLPEGTFTIRGQVDHGILVHELMNCDVVCFPSLYEACPLLMIEAMSLAKPVLAFDLPFARDVGKLRRTVGFGWQ